MKSLHPLETVRRWSDPKDLSPELLAEYDQLTDEIHELKGGVPSAPFIMDTNQWVALSLKRMVRWAADNKFDKIGWTTGSQQAARYDLSKHVSALHYDPESGHLVAYGLDERRYRPELHGQRVPLVDKMVPKSELSQHIGKEAARKLLETESVPLKYAKGATRGEQGEKILGRYHMLEDQELEIGGEGMKGFYDQIIANQAKALGKKYGAKVELEGIGATNVPSPLQGRHPRHEGRMMRIPESAFDAWTLNLTPKLRDAARKGLPYMVVLPPVVIGSQMMQEESPSGNIEMLAGGEWIQSDPVPVPAAQVRASRILEEAVP